MGFVAEATALAIFRIDSGTHLQQKLCHGALTQQGGPVQGHTASRLGGVLKNDLATLCHLAVHDWQVLCLSCIQIHKKHLATEPFVAGR